MLCDSMVTALYDFRSKQEFIYHTNKIQEISGASKLIENIYEEFYIACNGIVKLNSDLSEDFSIKAFKESEYDGQVIYKGGGNLYVLYKNYEVYCKANKVFSDLVIDTGYTLSLLVSKVNTTGNFNIDRKKLYEENARKKNTEYVSKPCNVLPYTQVDPITFDPIVVKKTEFDKPISLTREGFLKRKAYNKYKDKDISISISDIEKIADNNDDSLVAVIYTDGNGIGNKLVEVTKGIDDYDECVKALRNFSEKIKNTFVDEPINAINNRLKELSELNNYRMVIGGGDEITFICNAHTALTIARAYFDSLSKYDEYHAGMGIAICHSGDPFSEVYKIAEACCESAKKKTRNENCIDWHFCHSGIVADLESIRSKQYAEITNRPYRAKELFDMLDNNVVANYYKRTDIKCLRDSAIKGESWYIMEFERLKAKYVDVSGVKELSAIDEVTMKEIFDISGVYDLWIGSK